MKQRRQKSSRASPSGWSGTSGYLPRSRLRPALALTLRRPESPRSVLAMGLDGVSIVADRGASAKSLERPVLRTLLAQVRSGEVSTIVVLKLDRLTLFSERPCRSTRPLRQA